MEMGRIGRRARLRRVRRWRTRVPGVTRVRLLLRMMHRMLGVRIVPVRALAACLRTVDLGARKVPGVTVPQHRDELHRRARRARALRRLSQSTCWTRRRACSCFSTGTTKSRLSDGGAKSSDGTATSCGCSTACTRGILSDSCRSCHRRECRSMATISLLTVHFWRSGGEGWRGSRMHWSATRC